MYNPTETNRNNELDQLANERGHQIIRLPCYHCQYNPIELVWAQVKREVAKKDSTFTLTDVDRLMSEELYNVTQAQWASGVRHAGKHQGDDFLKEIDRDTILEPIIINLQETDSDNEETDESDGGSVCDNIDEDEPLLAVPLE